MSGSGFGAEGSGFVHSIKVPTQYKRVAAVLKTTLEKQPGKSLKSLIFQEKHASLRGMQAVLRLYAENREAIDNAIEKTKILEQNPRFCPALCKVLVTELIYGRKSLKSDCKPVVIIRDYQERLLKVLNYNSVKTKTTNTKVEKPRYVRINTNLLSLSDALEMLVGEGWHQKEYPPFEDYDQFLEAVKILGEDEFMFDMHMKNLLIFHFKKRYYWAKHDYVKEKKFMLQDKATCLVSELLNPPTGATVLDMCAAPGMKTIHVSNVIKNKGKIYAVEQSADRFGLLKQMTNAAGCKIVETINGDALKINDERCPNVEYILVDPSCSCSGMQNRLSLAYEEEKKDDKRLYKLAGLQMKILSHAMSAFPKVKRIVYSTCSLYEEENEQVVKRCLEWNPQYKLLNGKKELRKNWKNFGNRNYTGIGKNCLYARPAEDLSDGIFIAIFEKKRDFNESENTFYD